MVPGWFSTRSSRRFPRGVPSEWATTTRLQVSIRKRFSNGLQFDVNYTWSKSIDLGSAQEGAGSFCGFIQNTWNPSQMRAVSSYDTTQQINVLGVYALPFGRGRKFGSSMNKIADALVGGWQVTGNYRQTSGLPFTVGNGSRWPTDWNVSANATPIGPVPISMTNNAIGHQGRRSESLHEPLCHRDHARGAGGPVWTLH